jgi:hypothetical protein
VPTICSLLDVYLTDFKGVSRTKPKVSWFESNAEAALFHWNDAETAARSTYKDLAEFWPRAEIMGRVAEETLLRTCERKMLLPIG